MSGPQVVEAARPALAALLGAPEVRELFAALDRDGEELRIVGGAVRNVLMGLPAHDIDIAVERREGGEDVLGIASCGAIFPICRSSEMSGAGA